MKGTFGSLWQEVIKALKLLMRSPLLLKTVLRLVFLIYRLIEWYEDK